MQQYRKLLFPALALCFLLVLGGYYLGRRSVDGFILTTQRTPEVTESAALRLLLPAVETQTTEKQEIRLDLNEATLEELMALPGIGEVRAQRILEYRAEHGPFRQAAELMNVTGIGEKIFAGLRDLVYVEERYENSDH